MQPRHLPPVQTRDTASARGPALLLTAALALPPAAFCASAAAQSPDALRISVPAKIVASSDSPVPLGISVGPPDRVPDKSFVNVRGLPPSVGLTGGYSIAPGAWAVPLNGLATLKAYIPADLSGDSEITIGLVGVDGRLLAMAKTSLIIRPPAAGVQPPRTVAASPAPAPRPPQVQLRPAAPLLSADLAAAERLFARGEASLANGNVEVARQFFLRAAEAGLARAALQLGATYDAAELGKLKAQGVVPDAALARKWYERARDLGAPEALDRLAHLDGS